MYTFFVSVVYDDAKIAEILLMGKLLWVLGGWLMVMDDWLVELVETADDRVAKWLYGR